MINSVWNSSFGKSVADNTGSWAVERGFDPAVALSEFCFPSAAEVPESPCVDVETAEVKPWLRLKNALYYCKWKKKK